MEDLFAALEPYRWIHGSTIASELPNLVTGRLDLLAAPGGEEFAMRESFLLFRACPGRRCRQYR
jgi:hypothetical protein